MPDAAVVAFSRKFIWVEVNRDHTPELAKKFNMQAYPTLMTLGRQQEKVHRVSGYKKPPEFIKDLENALNRYQLYARGEEWDFPDPRPASIVDGRSVETFQAPGVGVPAGIESLDGDIWVGQVGELFRVDPKTGATKSRLELNKSVMDLATDGKVLYGILSGWTAGHPIQIIDPATGAVTGEIVTEANKKNKSYGAKGLAWRNGRLYALEGLQGLIHEIDPRTGNVLRTMKTGERTLSGLAIAGEDFLAGSRTHLVILDGKTGTARERIPVNYWLRAVGYHAGSAYMMVQPEFGYDKDHKWMQVWPDPKQMLVFAMPLR